MESKENKSWGGVALRKNTSQEVKDIDVKGIIGNAGAEDVEQGKKLFETKHPTTEWAKFKAMGYNKPVSGVIYRKCKPATCGVPLGGIDTGCIDLETSGLWGYSTVFNTHVPRRGPLNVPVLGLNVSDKTWVLCDPSQTKKPVHWGTYYDKAPEYPSELTKEPSTLNFEQLNTPSEIHYFGHYPIVDMEYEIDSPVSIGMRAWSPFYPGHLEDSMIPGSSFEVHLRNTTKTKQTATVAFNFPGPLTAEAGTGNFNRQSFNEGNFNAVLVQAPDASYAVGVMGDGDIKFGKDLGADTDAWKNFAMALPLAESSDSGLTASSQVVLEAGECKVIRFLLTWVSPKWKGGGYNWFNKDIIEAEHGDGLEVKVPNQCFDHRYAIRYPVPDQTMVLLAQNYESLLQRIIAWQSVVYTDESLPAWLQDSLINNLYIITESGMWADAKEPIPDWVSKEDGLFGVNECPRGCPQIECIPCSFYGNLPLVYFFPELALSTLRGYKGYQKSNGDICWTFSSLGNINFASENHGFQTVLNGLCYASMVDRYALCWPDQEIVPEFYESVKNNLIFTLSLRPGYETGDAIISMPAGNKELDNLSAHWFEAPEPGWWGMVPHVGGLHLAQIQIAERLAKQVGDQEFADQCQEWYKAGSKSLEEKTWLGSHYMTFWEPESDKRSDLVFAYQLDGEWVSNIHGLDGVFLKDRVETTLETIKNCNTVISSTGATNYAKVDGSPVPVGGYGTYGYFPQEVLMLAMTYIYNGQKEFGMYLAQRCWENIVCKQGYTWDMPNIMCGDEDTGEVIFGNDYHQNMLLWFLPAALAGQDLSAGCRDEGLISRMCKAADKK